MATHSSILAWRIPWTEESAGLQLMGYITLSYRDSAATRRLTHTDTDTHTHTHTKTHTLNT